MEAAPPSYEAAITRDHWELIAEFLPRQDLCSAVLVCREWHRIFSKKLWGNPVAHFDLNDSAVYIALSHFKWTLPWARLSTRQLTHTLRLPPAIAGLYDGPQAEWLRITLETLPKLQSFIVHGIPFFDHASLLGLRNHRSPRNTLYELRLLDASSCKNATAEGLAEVLPRTPALVYLDLSWTLGAVDSFVISKLKWLRSLRILKVRGLSLTDENLRQLTKAIGLRVRSLDLRNNKISDQSARHLLESCFLSPETRQSLEQNLDTSEGRGFSNGLPSYVQSDQVHLFQGENFEDSVYKVLSRDFVTRLALEDATDVGLTHLYMSDNNMTVEGAIRLLRGSTLNVFDLGDPRILLNRAESKISGLPNHAFGAELLTQLLSTEASRDLTYLRINHAIITKDMPFTELVREQIELSKFMPSDDAPTYAEVSQLTEIIPQPHTGHTALEEGASPAYEVSPADNEKGGQPVCELLERVLSLAISDTSEPDDGRLNATDSLHGASTLSANLDSKIDARSINSRDSGSTATGGPSMMSIPTESRNRRYSSVLEERRQRSRTTQNTFRHFHPAMMPKLRTLVLTGVPSHVASKDLSERLIDFIRECSEETFLSNLEAQSNHALPFGRAQNIMELRKHASSIFALNRIVLEFEDTQELKISRGWNYRSNTRSVTEDTDSEALWNAAETDFSFFTEGQPNNPEYKAYPSTGKQVARDYDTIAELISYRKSSRQRYESMVNRDDTSSHGHWTGKVEVIRPAPTKRQVRPIYPENKPVDLNFSSYS